MNAGRALGPGPRARLVRDEPQAGEVDVLRKAGQPAQMSVGFKG